MDVKPVWRVEKWEDDEYIITLNGKPVGQTVTFHEGQDIVEWLKTSWREMVHAAS